MIQLFWMAKWNSRLPLKHRPKAATMLLFTNSTTSTDLSNYITWLNSSNAFMHAFISKSNAYGPENLKWWLSVTFLTIGHPEIKAPAKHIPLTASILDAINPIIEHDYDKEKHPRCDQCKFIHPFSYIRSVLFILEPEMLVLKLTKNTSFVLAGLQIIPIICFRCSSKLVPCASREWWSNVSFAEWC